VKYEYFTIEIEEIYIDKKLEYYVIYYGDCSNINKEEEI